MTPLCRHVATRRAKCVNLLLRQGCAVNPKDKGGMTPLDWANEAFRKAGPHNRMPIQLVLDP